MYTCRSHCRLCDLWDIILSHPVQVCEDPKVSTLQGNISQWYFSPSCSQLAFRCNTLYKYYYCSYFVPKKFKALWFWMIFIQRLISENRRKGFISLCEWKTEFSQGGSCTKVHRENNLFFSYCLHNNEIIKSSVSVVLYWLVYRGRSSGRTHQLVITILFVQGDKIQL